MINIKKFNDDPKSISISNPQVTEPQYMLFPSFITKTTISDIVFTLQSWSLRLLKNIKVHSIFGFF